MVEVSRFQVCYESLVLKYGLVKVADVAKTPLETGNMFTVTINIQGYTFEGQALSQVGLEV